MLRVDPGEVRRKGRIPIEEDVPVGHDLWHGSGVRPAQALHVRLVARMAQSDLVVRGAFSGVARCECRRCLRELTRPIEGDVTLVYRAGLSPVDAEDAEAYRLPERTREVDLVPALREHVILAAPRFVLCQDDCRGLCPRCGADMNDDPCDCEGKEEDPRWAGLRSRGN
jgi:DUF177 domain-containing protein